MSPGSSLSLKSRFYLLNEKFPSPSKIEVGWVLIKLHVSSLYSTVVQLNQLS